MRFRPFPRPLHAALTLFIGLAGTPEALASGKNKVNARKGTKAAPKHPPAVPEKPFSVADLGPDKVGPMGPGKTGLPVLNPLIRRGADLRGMTFPKGFDFRPYDLRDADLTGAHLEGANFTGVNLTGTRLFGATVTDAVGLDLTGALVHPFFRDDGDEAVGKIKYYDFHHPSEEAPEAPRCLAVTRDGQLHWIPAPGSSVLYLNPVGSMREIQGARNHAILDGEFFTLVTDALDRLWLFGDKNVWVLRGRQPDPSGKDHMEGHYPTHRPLPGPPLSIAPGASGNVLVALEDRLINYFTGLNANNEPAMQRGIVQPSPETKKARAVFGPEDKWLVYAPLGQERLVQRVIGSKEQRIMPLDPGGGAERLVLAPDGKVWFTQPGASRVGFWDPVAKTNRVYRVGEDPAARSPHGLALGPDGHLWFTDRAAGMICRIDPAEDGITIKEFPLPNKGEAPLELIGSHQGRLYFTLEGKGRIGSIRALPSKAQAEGKLEDAKASSTLALEPEPSIPRPAPRIKRSRRERNERHQRILVPRAEPEDPGDSKAASVVPGLPAVAAEPPGTLSDRLEEAGIHLSDRAIEHALEEHGPEGDPEKSTFAKAFWDPGKLEALIGESLLKAGEIGRVLGARGRGKTHCFQAGVGTYWRFDRRERDWIQEPTDWFCVITEGSGSGAQGEYDVVTAYPCSPNW